jgi:ribosomal protein S18 acetylase RimI-like enzyme
VSGPLAASGATIRLAGPDDVERLVALSSAFRDELRQGRPSDAEMGDAYAAHLRDGDADFVLACASDGEPLGYVALRVRRSVWAGGFEGELEAVFVAPQARGRGVGRSLVVAALNHARRRDCGVVALSTNERNEPALGLYRALGFRAERTRWDGGRQLWLECPLDADFTE